MMSVSNPGSGIALKVFVWWCSKVVMCHVPEAVRSIRFREGGSSRKKAISS